MRRLWVSTSSVVVATVAMIAAASCGTRDDAPKDAGPAQKRDATASGHDASHGRDAAQDAGRDSSTGGRDASVPPCEAQDARSDGTECAGAFGYAWDGRACKRIECGCTGADCARVARKRSTCEEDHASCWQPECHTPWYRCEELCPATLNFFGGGRSFGRCAGECSFELTMNPPSFPLEGGACVSAGTAELRITGTPAGVRLVTITLNDAAAEQVFRIARDLQDLALDPVTGCPDCADGGSAWITTVGGDGSNRRYTYELGNPPEPLEAADALVQALIDEAKTCHGTHIDSCQSYDGVADAGAGYRDSCSSLHPVAETFCTCPNASIFALEGEACDGSCGECQNGTCWAQCLRACDRDDVSWHLSCTE